jgi:hypothetical protein
MSIGYMWEVLYRGTRSLASGTGRIQERLEDTFIYMAGRLTGPNMDLPADLEVRAQEIIRRGTCMPAKGDEGTIAATCRSMSDQEAVSLAEEIVSLYDAVCRLHGIEDYKAEQKQKT